MKRQYITPAMVPADVTAEDLIMLSIQIKDDPNEEIDDEGEVWVRQEHHSIWDEENMW